MTNLRQKKETVRLSTVKIGESMFEVNVPGFLPKHSLYRKWIAFFCPDVRRWWGGKSKVSPCLFFLSSLSHFPLLLSIASSRKSISNTGIKWVIMF